MPIFGGTSVGQVLDRRYVITRRLGSDGMGIMYQADDAEEDISVLIRALPKVIPDNAESMEQLRRRAGDLLNLSHTNIVSLLAFDLDGPVKYFVFEYIEGETLRERLSSGGPLSVEQAGAVFTPLGDALDYAHSQNYLHRDINPSNILLASDGSPRLMNFDITRWVKDALAGTEDDLLDDAFLFSAPEQFSNAKLQHRSDIYSFAATIYHCLCRPPLIWRGWMEYQVLNEQPAALRDLDDRQNAALLKALSRDCRFRYRSTYKFFADLNLGAAVSSIPEKRDDGHKSLAEQAVGQVDAEIGAELRTQTQERVKAEQKAEAEAKARVQADANLRVENQARFEAERKAKAEAEARAEAERRAVAEAEARAQADARLQTEQQARFKAEQKARAEAAARAEAESLARVQSESLAARIAEAEAKLQAEADARARAEEQASAEAREKARLEKELKRRVEQAEIEKARLEAKQERRAEAEARRSAKAEAREKARIEKESRKQAKIEARQEARSKAAITQEAPKASLIDKQAKEYAKQLARVSERPASEVGIGVDFEQGGVLLDELCVTSELETAGGAPGRRKLGMVLALAVVVALVIAGVFYVRKLKSPRQAVQVWTQANVLAAQQDYTEAITAANSLIARFPEYARKQSVPQIKLMWEKALATDKARHVWAEAKQCAAQSKYDQAIDNAVLLLNKYPDTPFAAEATANLPKWRKLVSVREEVGKLLTKAKLARDANDLDAARGALGSALELDPENGAAEVMKAQIEAAKEAEVLVRQIAEEKRRQLDEIKAKALARQEAGDWEEAIDLYNRASALDPADVEITAQLAFCRYNLHFSNADAARATGDFGSAVNFYTEALAQTSDPVLKRRAESIIAELEARKEAEKNKGEVQSWVNMAGEAESRGDFPTAVEWYRKASDANDPGAMYKLALAYHNGSGVEQDITQTIGWFTKAADAGISDAMLRLGLIYHAGDGVAKDLGKALEWYKKAADAGNAEAMHNLGAMYYTGQGASANVQEAIRWLEKAALAGNVQAMYNIAVAYYNGDGIEKDYDKAVGWFRKAADANDVPAMYNLALAYLDAGNYQNAKQWLTRAAKGGSTEAVYNLGVMYHNGLGFARDFEEARRCYRKAAEGGDTNAMVNLGLLHSEGLGMPEDPGKAVEWYLKAANAGNPRGMSNLAMAYYNGAGLAKNPRKAVEWLQKAAQLGENMAMFNLGLMYQNGWAVTKDTAKAVEWYKKGANAGDAQAMYNLAVIYRSGQGVGKDPNQMLKYLKEAAKSGHSEAQKDLTSLGETW
ncbi:MAG: SEL1-like repeat protein [Sedimentisphaerales bacterium]|nr:SEL1-like repeat protein [Sedimentisphaerales bacterium]